MGLLLDTVAVEDLSDWHRLRKDLKEARDELCGHPGRAFQTEGTGSIKALNGSMLGAKLSEREVG